MASYNNIQLLGNIGRVSVKTFPSGDKVVEASIATTRRYKDRNGELKEVTQWHRLIIRGSGAEYAEKYVKTGATCFAAGEMTYRDYKDRDGNARTIAEVSVSVFEKVKDAPERDAAAPSREEERRPSRMEPAQDPALRSAGLVDTDDAGDGNDLPF